MVKGIFVVCPLTSLRKSSQGWCNIDRRQTASMLLMFDGDASVTAVSQITLTYSVEFKLSEPSPNLFRGSPTSARSVRIRF